TITCIGVFVISGGTDGLGLGGEVNSIGQIADRKGCGNVSNRWIQRWISGAGQEDISDCLGRWRTEEHESQLEVNKQSQTNINKQAKPFTSYPAVIRYYLDDCKALVFVVDSSDPARLPEAQKVLKKVLSEEKLRGVPLMVLANKKDLANSMNIREISNQLDLQSHDDRLWEIQACSALKGLGLLQAFMSISKLIKKSN
uniref:ADP-ribosylation factor-like 11 n=1 Tax=Gasterosteus aculeatus aculeatus TaxID=481459 RepID=A0AAQ4P110_GASAC